MCGRYTLAHFTPDELKRIFLLQNLPDLRPRYNIAPTQNIAAIREDRDTRERNLELLRWGLIPSWAKEEKISARMINLRDDTVTQKPSFKGALRYRRCLIPADGFYEWTDAGPGAKKQPVYIRRRDGAPFAFGGLWDHWVSPTGAEIESCTIITTEPNDLVRPVHDRMPVIIPGASYEEWLDPDNHDGEVLGTLLAPYPPDEMEAYPVSQYVNSPAHEDAQCIQPIETA